MKQIGSTLLFVMLALWLCACSGASSNGNENESKPDHTGHTGRETPSQSSFSQNPAPQEPVTLVLYLAAGTLTDEEFQAYFAAPVKEKYPHVTMDFVKTGQGTRPADMVAGGSSMDIIYASQGGWKDLFDLGLPHDLTELTKANQTKLDLFRSFAIEWIQGLADGKLYGLPFSLNGSALFYNKDIFEKFGVSYPEDQMLWDDVLELGRKVARSEEGITYKPLFVGSLDQFAGQLSPSYANSSTGMALLESEVWKKAAEYYKAIHDLPGNPRGVVAEFFKEKHVAMYAGVTIYTIGQLQQLYDAGEPFNWDLVSYPNFPESIGQGMPLDVHSIILSATSKHKEQAFEVMSYVLSEENQLAASRDGRISALTATVLQEQYGQELPFLEGKNISAVFKTTPSTRDQGEYYGIIAPLIATGSNKLISGEEDVNTMLRNINEAANRAIQEVRQ